MQAADEGIRLQRLTQLLVVRFAAHRKIGRQIVVGIPIAISATDPDFFAPHALAHGLEHEQLVADAIDSLAAFFVMLDDQLEPAGSHNTADGDDLVEPEGARLAANVTLQQLDGLDDRLVRVVVRAELECVEQWLQQTPVVRLIRTTHRLVELAAIARSSGLVLADQLVEDALTANGGEDDVSYDAVGPFDRGLGHSEQ